MDILLLIILFLIILTNYYKTRRSFHMLQQNLYNENNRYLKWLSKNKKEIFRVDIIPFLLLFLNLLIDNKFLLIISFIISILIYIMEILILRYEQGNSQNKKPLVFTKRIRRLTITMTLLFLIPIILIFVNHDQYLVFTIILMLLTSFNFYTVFLAHIINYPIERGIYHYYEHKAKTKLKNMTNLKIIGITGSYGKTSSKNILSDILNIKYNALPTPKNLNTYYGLMITVNNHLTKFDDIFIAEMGAYVKGEIAGLCKLVHPKYGILTTIGTAHLETFGSEQNIIDGKFELIESLPQDGLGILNGDDPKQVNYQLKNNCQIKWIGINNHDVDLYATDIEGTNNGCRFNVCFKGDNKKYSFETKLLGNHNVYNLLAGILLGHEFGISINELQQAVKMVKPVEHRLELKRLGNYYQIDDAYNSNPVGAKMALDVLKLMPGTKVVVTPGMIELGAKEEELNRIFGEQISEVSDYVILVGKNRTKPIYEGLISKKYSKDKIIIINDVREAYPILTGLKDENELYALFENDLPDTYNE